MSQEIIVPRESFSSVLAFSESAKIFCFLFLGAVAGGHVAVNISSAIEFLITCRIGAGKISAMGLDMFANRTLVSVLYLINITVEKTAVRTGARVSARMACDTLDKERESVHFMTVTKVKKIKHSFKMGAYRIEKRVDVRSKGIEDLV